MWSLSYPFVRKEPPRVKITFNAYGETNVVTMEQSGVDMLRDKFTPQVIVHATFQDARHGGPVNLGNLVAIWRPNASHFIPPQNARVHLNKEKLDYRGRQKGENGHLYSCPLVKDVIDEGIVTPDGYDGYLVRIKPEDGNLKHAFGKWMMRIKNDEPVLFIDTLDQA